MSTKQMWLGQSIRLASPLLDWKGSPATVTGAAFTVTKPDTSTVEIEATWDAEEGEWFGIAVADQAGRWRAEFVTDGPLVGVDVIWFEVKARTAA